MHGFDAVELVEPVVVAPGGEAGHGAAVGPARVRIADRGGEELKGAAGGALVRREQGRQRDARDGDGVRPDDLDNGRKLATAGSLPLVIWEC